MRRQMVTTMYNNDNNTSAESAFSVFSVCNIRVLLKLISVMFNPMKVEDTDLASFFWFWQISRKFRIL